MVKNEQWDISLSRYGGRSGADMTSAWVFSLWEWSFWDAQTLPLSLSRDIVYIKGRAKKKKLPRILMRALRLLTQRVDCHSVFLSISVAERLFVLINRTSMVAVDHKEGIWSLKGNFTVDKHQVHLPSFAPFSFLSVSSPLSVSKGQPDILQA